MTKSWEKAVPNEPFSSVGWVNAVCWEIMECWDSSTSQGMNELRVGVGGGQQTRTSNIL